VTVHSNDRTDRSGTVLHQSEIKPVNSDMTSSVLAGGAAAFKGNAPEADACKETKSSTEDKPEDKPEDVSNIGINKLIPLLREHCRGLRADGDIVAVITEATEPIPDQQVDGDDKTFLPRTSMAPRNSQDVVDN
jgi:hypothetical protein